MSTETTTETGLEHWVMELPEDEAGCVWTSGCESAAEWHGLTSCCAHSCILCDTHKEASERHRDLMVVICPACAVPYTVRWHRI